MFFFWGLQPLPPKQNGVGHGLPAVHQLSQFHTTQDAFGGGALRVGTDISRTDHPRCSP